MNSKTKNLIKNFSYTFTSNLFVLFISTLVILILPKVLGIEEYGYWQLYILYTSYTALLHLGWNDGIYLRYGGKEYQELDKHLFFSQFWMLVIFEAVITMVAIVLVGIFVSNSDKTFVIRMMVVCSLLVIPRGMLLFILQGTNRIKDYAIATIIEKIVYATLIIFFLLVGIRQYQLMIAADIMGKGISLLYATMKCKDIVFRKFNSFFLSFEETVENVRVGLNVALAFVISSLIVGTVRFGIEYTWDIETFGKVSLTLSISNLMMIFINAIGIIIFPILKRTDKKNLPSIYITMRDFLMVILLGALIVYYPLKIVLLAWLPKYADSLKYMALVFPMCVFEGKMALLINTYLKTLRKEKLMLKINLISLALSVMITFVTTILFKNLNLAITSIVILLAFRCALAELFLSKILTISLSKDIILELIMTLIFILTGWFIKSWIAVLLYAIAYIMYLTIKRKDITNTIKNLKLLMKA